jgi:hypothetical protein
MHQAMKWIVGGSVVLAACGGAIAQNAQPGSPSPITIPPPAATNPGEFHGPFPAPVGHRQPKQADLPPDVVKKENRGEQGRDFDAKLRICKGC